MHTTLSTSTFRTTNLEFIDLIDPSWDEEDFYPHVLAHRSDDDTFFLSLEEDRRELRFAI